MQKIIPAFYKTFGQYSNYRNFPMLTDGLKPVERRVLLSAYKIARDKFVKSRQVDAHTIGHYHPHGETYGTIVSLVRQGLLIGQGNFGSNHGASPVGPAAPRYTECKMAPLTLEIAFKYVKYVDWIDTELGDKEPIYLPTMFPICLMGKEYTQGIGFGYKTFIPCFELKDLKRRLLWLLGATKTEPIIQPISDCTITANNKILKELLTTGTAKIDVQGIVEEIPHQNKIILKSWPQGKRFESFLKKFSTELSSEMIGYRDASVTSTEIVFDVIRQRNRDKIYSDFVSKLKEFLVGTLSFDMVMVNEKHEVVVTSVDNLLMNSYKIYKKALNCKLVEEIADTKRKINDYEIILKIRPSIKRNMIGKIEVAEKIKAISSETGVPVEDIERIMTLNIKKLLTMDLDIRSLEDHVSETEKKIENIENLAIEEYSNI